MVFAPTIHRELRVRARQVNTYWGRCFIAGAAGLMVLEFARMAGSTLPPAGIGAATFRILSMSGLLLICGAAWLTADCIGSERREGTLGLLFLTELSARDVVFGKLVSSGLAAFYGLIALLPVLAFALLPGGVSLGHLIRTALALLNGLCFTLAMGLAVSACTPMRDQALKRVATLTVLFFGVPALCSLVLPATGPRWGLLLVPTPFGPFLMARDSFYSTLPLAYWFSLLITHLEAWLLAALAVWHLRRNWLETAEAVPSLTPQPKLKPRQRNDAHLETSPIRWLASREPGNRFLVWTGAVLLVASVLGGSWLIPSLSWRQNGMGLLLNLAASAPFAWLAGRFFFEARRSGELELLLSTPLGARSIVEGYWWTVWDRLRGPLLLACFVAFFQSALLLANLGGGASGDAATQLVLLPVTRIFDVVAVSWVAMWLGLKARRSSQIVAWTAGLVIALPWLVITLLLVWPQSGLLAVFGPTPLTMLGILYILKDVLFVTLAARQLRSELRTAAPVAVREWFKA